MLTEEAQDADVIVEGSEHGVLTIRFNAPERLNAVDVPMLRAVVEALRAAEGDPEVRAVVLTGTGRAFCSGADLAAGPERRGNKPSGMVEAVNEAVQSICDFPKPVVCLMNGLAAGVGVSFALACDLTVAVSSAFFALSFTNIGLLPDGGATKFMAASIGRARTMRLAMTAERLSAEEAANEGLIAWAVPEEEYTETTAAVVDKIARGATLALAEVKHLVNGATLQGLPEQLNDERDRQMRLKVTSDHVEGVRAFSERRKPVFTARVE